MFRSLLSRERSVPPESPGTFESSLFRRLVRGGGAPSLKKTLEGHRGCVNTACWTLSGEHIISGSDDTRVCVFAPAARSPRPSFSFDSGHTANIFCARLLERGSFCAGEAARLVTTAADGTVRLHTLRTEGGLQPVRSEVLHSHGRRAHRVAVGAGGGGGAQHFATCGEDGVLRVCDARAPRAAHAALRLIKRRSGAPVRLFALDWAPGGGYELATGGDGVVMYVLDVRRAGGVGEAAAVREYLPDHLRPQGVHHPRHASYMCVTSAHYSVDGKRLVAALNDESTYVYRLEGEGRGARRSACAKGAGADVVWLPPPAGGAPPEGGGAPPLPPPPPPPLLPPPPLRAAPPGAVVLAPLPPRPRSPSPPPPPAFRRGDYAGALARFSAHQNADTIKGVSFFGPRSELVLQGCDSGRAFLYDAFTAEVVAAWEADRVGAVNVLAPHPDATQPLLATSGLEDDVKLWAFYGSRSRGDGGGGGSDDNEDDVDEDDDDNDDDDDDDNDDDDDDDDGDMMEQLHRAESSNDSSTESSDGVVDLTGEADDT